MNFKSLFKRNKPRHQLFDIVVHKEQNRRGMIVGVGIVYGTIKLRTINVQFADGRLGIALPENEFTNLTRSTY